MTGVPGGQTLVVGAGPTGLTAALRLAAAGRPTVLAEAKEYVGGLATTFTFGDQLFDVGPHGLSLRPGEIRDLVSEVLGNRLYTVPLVRRMYRDGTFYEHPFSAPDFWARSGWGERLRASADYLFARGSRFVRAARPERSFEEWAARRYGTYLYDYYIRSYSVKSWGPRLQQLSPLWAEQRLYDPRPAAVLAAFLGRGNKTTEQVQHYCDGGIGTLAGALAERCTHAGAAVRLGTKVEALRRSGSGWEAQFASGEVSGAYDEVIWTGPLEDAARSIVASQPERQRTVDSWLQKLRYRGAIFVYIDLDRPPNLTFTSCYVADPKLPFCRIYEPAWYLRGDERARSRALCLEYHAEEGGESTIPGDDGELAEMSLAALSRVPGYQNVARRGKCLGVIRVDKHYPLLDEPAVSALAELLPYLTSNGVIPAGRAGLFRYVNIDVAMEMGLRAADTVLGVGTFDSVNSLGMERAFREALVRVGPSAS